MYLGFVLGVRKIVEIIIDIGGSRSVGQRLGEWFGLDKVFFFYNFLRLLFFYFKIVYLSLSNSLQVIRSYKYY